MWNHKKTYEKLFHWLHNQKCFNLHNNAAGTRLCAYKGSKEERSDCVKHSCTRAYTHTPLHARTHTHTHTHTYTHTPSPVGCRGESICLWMRVRRVVCPGRADRFALFCSAKPLPASKTSWHTHTHTHTHIDGDTHTHIDEVTHTKRDGRTHTHTHPHTHT